MPAHPCCVFVGGARMVIPLQSAKHEAFTHSNCDIPGGAHMVIPLQAAKHVAFTHNNCNIPDGAHLVIPCMWRTKTRQKTGTHVQVLGIKLVIVADAVSPELYSYFGSRGINQHYIECFPCFNNSHAKCSI